MIVFFKKIYLPAKSILKKSIIGIGIFLSLILFLPELSFSSSDFISLDLNALDKNSSISENISDIFDISRPFIIPGSDIEKSFNQDVDVLRVFRLYKNHLHEYPEYSEIKHYSLKLLRYYYEKLILLPSFSISRTSTSSSFSSSSNLFIGIGSSPTPIISFWENLKELDSSYYVLQHPVKTYLDFSEFLTIPFSKNIVPEYSYYSLIGQQLPIYKERYLKLFKLFDLYSKGVVFENKNIIIMDFAVSGLSIALFTRIFLKYLEFKNITPRSINLHLITTLSPNNFMLRLNTLENVVVENICEDYTLLSFKLYNSNYDKVTKYPYYQGYYRKQDYSYPIQLSPNYVKYSSILKNNIKKDHDIVLRGCPLLFSVMNLFKK